MKRLLLLLLLSGSAFATVPLVPYTVTYTCTGGYGPYAFTFPISDPTAMTVTLNGVVLASTSYTIVAVNNNYNNGGSVTLAGGYPCSSGTLVLTRTTPIDQLIQFYDNMPSLPMITGRSVDKLTEIAQELDGLIGQITQLGVSITAVYPIVVTPSPLTGIGIISCPTCAAGGTVTSVTGTVNQIDVATGTTTPVLSFDNNIVFPGNIKMNPNTADFSAATSFLAPVSASASASVAGYIAYNSTSRNMHFQTNSADSIPAAFASAPAGSKCVHTNGATGLVTETSGDCSSLPGGNGVVRVNSGTPAVAEISGDGTTSGSNALTLATVNSNVGSFTSANITVNAKGLITAAANGAGGGTVTSSGSPVSGNIAKFTTATNIAPAAYTNIVALWASGSCSGYLKNDGTCSTPSSGVASIQPENNGTPYGSPLTGAITMNFANCTVSSTFTITCPTGVSVAGSSGDLQTNNGSSNLGAAHINDNATTMTVTESITPAVAAAKNLGTALLPWGDVFIGSGGASKAVDFTTSALTANRAVAIPDHASNTVQGIANPSDTQYVNYIDTSGVQNRLALPTKYSRSCEIAWSGSGTSFALQSGDDAVANNSCYNTTGSTETITAVQCKSDNGSNTTTVNPTFGAAGTGTTICSGALTCGSSNAYSSTCTVSNASLLNGNGISPAMSGTLTGTNIHIVITYTLP